MYDPVNYPADPDQGPTLADQFLSEEQRRKASAEAQLAYAAIQQLVNDYTKLQRQLIRRLDDYLNHTGLTFADADPDIKFPNEPKPPQAFENPESYIEWQVEHKAFVERMQHLTRAILELQKEIAANRDRLERTLLPGIYYRIGDVAVAVEQTDNGQHKLTVTDWLTVKALLKDAPY